MGVHVLVFIIVCVYICVIACVYWCANMRGEDQYGWVGC